MSAVGYWPTLQVGDFVTIRLGVGGRARGIIVVIEPDGALGLGVPPASSRGRWRPRWVLRQQVCALWGPHHPQRLDHLRALAGMTELSDRLLDKIAGPWTSGVGVSDCWLYQASWHSVWGYGRIREAGRGSRGLLAHREMLRISLAPGRFDPALVVRHTCDEPLCCNPLHLEQGTQLENLRDQIRRKRRKLARRGGGRWAHIFRMPEPADYELEEALG